MLRSLLATLFMLTAAVAIPPNIVVIVADDLGFNDLGVDNNGRTSTPHLDTLVKTGISLTNYYTFKICAPSRAAFNTGRYPWGAGFYDMSRDYEHCTAEFTSIPELLRPANYTSHALGKWDIGFMEARCSPTGRGFDTFFGYYGACQADYWYHGASGGYPTTTECEDNLGPTDFSNSSLREGVRAAPGLNGTYNRELFSGEAARLIRAHDQSYGPMYMYLAFMNIHDGCGRPFGSPESKAKLGLQAPLGTVTEYYATTASDTYKVSGAMLTELDFGIGEVVTALKEVGMYDNSIILFVSDNGGPLDHSTNYPLRGGKHTFWEGGVRVRALLSGGAPAIPKTRRGSTWEGMAHSSDWYRTFVEGLAHFAMIESTGTRPTDGFNLWPSIASGTASPRSEVVHQVWNSYFNESVRAIRVGDLKLIQGKPGDARWVKWPEPRSESVAFGTGCGVVEDGTEHARACGIYPVSPAPTPACAPYCLFNLTSDIGERQDLASDDGLRSIAEAMLERLDYHGATGPPNAWLYGTNRTLYQENVKRVCKRSVSSGFVEPLDV